MKPTIYTVNAFRYGDHDNHSYLVGVFHKKHRALKEAEIEEIHRGGKYECEVLEWMMDTPRIAGEDKPKVIKPIAKRKDFV